MTKLGDTILEGLHQIKQMRDGEEIGAKVHKMTTDKQVDKRNREWEMFCDSAYYDMWCVRCLDSEAKRDFNDHMSFHFMTQAKAQKFIKLVLESR